jgi:hydroxymethylglutaryl-CoA lyase
MLHLTECPRDAMQGIKEFIPTQTKLEYLQALLEVGFPVLDAGSFVSPSAIPQMADTAQVFDGLSPSATQILAIVANPRGAAEAASRADVRFLGYPFSVSETFQLRNTNATIAQSRERLSEIQKIAGDQGKELVVYLSMAFGNPYGDPWSANYVADQAEVLQSMGIRHVSLADTTGISTPDSVHRLFENISQQLPDMQWSVHLHSVPEEVALKTEAAWEAGCRKLDTALKGFGGCPMASNTLTGNMDTEMVVQWCVEHQIETGLNLEALQKASFIASRIFAQYH